MSGTQSEAEGGARTRDVLSMNMDGFLANVESNFVGFFLLRGLSCREPADPDLTITVEVPSCHPKTQIRFSTTNTRGLTAVFYIHPPFPIRA